MEYTADDARLDRRLKRRSIFNRNFKQDNSANVRKRTVNSDSKKDYAVLRDDDYQMDLDNLIKHGDPADIGALIVIDEPSFCEDTEGTCVNSEWDDDDDDVMVDPDYMMFCKGLREVGKSYVLEVARGDGEVVIDFERQVLIDRYPVSLVKSNSVRKRVNAERTETPWSSSSERAEKEDKSYMKYLENLEASLKERDNVRYTQCPTKLASDYDAGSCERAEKAAESSASERVEEADEPYMKVLNYFETSQKDCDAGSSDSEVIILDFDPSATETHSPFRTSKSVVVAVDVDSGSRLQSHRASPRAQFRAALMKDLRKPYNQAEYESLLEEATCRKETLGHRNFRSGIKSYKQESIGKSYLDIYGDVAAKINEAQSDRRRVLNILRGFFYWLKNLAHEGVFCPWHDRCCMETLPLSK